MTVVNSPVAPETGWCGYGIFSHVISFSAFARVGAAYTVLPARAMAAGLQAGGSGHDGAGVGCHNGAPNSLCLIGHKSCVKSVAFSPDSNRLC